MAKNDEEHDDVADKKEDVVALLKQIRDLNKQLLVVHEEHRQWLLLRVLLPMFAMVVILVVLVLVTGR